MHRDDAVMSDIQHTGAFRGDTGTFHVWCKVHRDSPWSPFHHDRSILHYPEEGKTERGLLADL